MLKFCLTAFFLFFLLLPGNGQQLLHGRIGYMSGFSYFIESNLHMNDEVSINPGNAVRISLPVISGDIKMGLLQNGKSCYIIHRIDFSYEKQVNGLDMEFRIDGADSTTGSWYPVSRSTKAGGAFFIDTVLEEGAKMRISFRKKGGKITQVVDLERRSILPDLTYYREAATMDTVKGSLWDAVVKGKKYLEGFRAFNNEVIAVKPGHKLELVFANQSLNEDSAIMYRLRTEHDSGSWQLSGHFTVLRNLKSNRNYILDVKYRDSFPSAKYEIHTAPYWYQTTVAITGFAVLALLVLFGFSYFRFRLKWNRERRKKEQMLYKLKSVQAQLNPHFIFNALASIQSLVNNNDRQRANEYLTDFSMVLRGALKNSEAVFIPLSEELELLGNYIRIEQLRFQFSYTIITDPSIQPGDVEVPPMLFQPSIENSIKHGIGGMGSKGTITIQIGRQENGFIVSIFDNGRWQEKPVTSGYGLSLTRERVAVINEISRERQIIYSIDKMEKGTAVCFYFQNWFI